MNARSDRAGHILIADDDESTVAILSAALRLTGFDVDTVYDGPSCLRAAADLRPDLVVLDAVLPVIDGFEAVARLKEGDPRIPVMFLSARSSSRERVRGLRLGAEDYLAKPFDLEELLLRIEVILRRNRADAPVKNPVLSCGDLELNEDTHEVHRAGRTIHLSPTEYRMLKYLLVNAKTVLSKAQLFEHTWGYAFTGNNQIIESYIHLLRKKIDFAEPRLVHTVRGFGYTLKLPAAARATGRE
ncbi:response regulator transcription factor [Glycomyces sp. NPDC047010]|uniref:response regulator transcription factor n=1 Tax=Glycomyces sp. NPDC047010 TaxID=3155023 RepID=UPI0033F15329